MFLVVQFWCLGDPGGLGEDYLLFMVLGVPGGLVGLGGPGGLGGSCGLGDDWAV